MHKIHLYNNFISNENCSVNKTKNFIKNILAINDFKKKLILFLNV